MSLSDSSGNFYNYRTLPLRTYFEIVESGNYRLVNPRGKGTVEQCMDAWESIIKTYSQESNTSEYYAWFRSMRNYWKLYAKHAVLAASIMLLKIRVDKKVVEDVRKMGYTIDTTNSASYKRSLEVLEPKIRTLHSQLKIRHNELAAMEVAKEQELKETDGKSSFDSVIALLSLSSGFNIPEDITLSRYMEMVKAVKAKNKTVEEYAERQKAKR